MFIPKTKKSGKAGSGTAGKAKEKNCAGNIKVIK